LVTILVTAFRAIFDLPSIHREGLGIVPLLRCQPCSRQARLTSAVEVTRTRFPNSSTIRIAVVGSCRLETGSFWQRTAKCGRCGCATGRRFITNTTAPLMHSRAGPTILKKLRPSRPAGSAGRNIRPAAAGPYGRDNSAASGW